MSDINLKTFLPTAKMIVQVYVCVLIINFVTDKLYTMYKQRSA